tara:strand:+ start:1192 stop:2424 length:1233 start_codon:yes stop_codon:yes gene_type:complete
MIKQKPEILSGKSWSGLSPIDKIYKIHNELKEAQDDSFETSVVDALQRIKQGMSYEEWLDSTSMGPAVKAEVKKRLSANGAKIDDEESKESPKHDKHHITRAVFDSLPDDEKNQHQDGLRSAMKSHGMHDDEESEESEEQAMGEEEPQEEPIGDQDLDYEIGDDEAEAEAKVKKEPNMKLSKKKEKVTINPRMEGIEFKNTELSMKALKKKRKHLIHQLKDIDKEILGNIPNNPEDDLEDYNKEKGLKEKAPPGREDQVKSLKGKVGKDAAYAIAWAQHNKHGRPKSESASQRYKKMVQEKKSITQHEDVDFGTSYTNIKQSSMSPLEILKSLKDKVDANDPTKMRGKSWSDMEDERFQQLSAMVRTGKNVLMFLDTPTTGDTYGLEEFVFVMRDKIPKYEKMGYKIVAE